LLSSLSFSSRVTTKKRRYRNISSEFCFIIGISLLNYLRTSQITEEYSNPQFLILLFSSLLQVWSNIYTDRLNLKFSSFYSFKILHDSNIQILLLLFLIILSPTSSYQTSFWEMLLASFSTIRISQYQWELNWCSSVQRGVDFSFWSHRIPDSERNLRYGQLREFSNPTNFIGEDYDSNWSTLINCKISPGYIFSNMIDAESQVFS